MAFKHGGIEPDDVWALFYVKCCFYCHIYRVYRVWFVIQNFRSDYNESFLYFALVNSLLGWVVFSEHMKNDIYKSKKETLQ